MQCLYCETELKAFRNFFDEDFCCRDHRDRYNSSFRKGLTRLPPDEMMEAVSTAQPPVAVLEEPVSTAQEPVALACPDASPADPRIADVLPTAVTPAPAVESYRTAGHDVLGDLLAIRIPGVQRSWISALDAGKWPAELAGPAEIEIAASAPEPRSVASAPFMSDVFPLHGVSGIRRAEANWTTAFEIEQRTVELAEPVEMAAAPSTPEPLPFTPVDGVIGIQRPETGWTAALKIEHLPAELAEPAQIAAAATAIEPLLFSITPFPPVLETGVGAGLLETSGLFADLFTDGEIQAAPAEAYLSGRLESLHPTPVALEVPSLVVSAAGPTSALLADPAEFALLCRQLISAPEPVSAVALQCEYTAPAFTASRENMRCEEVAEFDLPTQAETVNSADPEIAPPLAVNSGPVASVSSRPAGASAMLRPPLEMASANTFAHLSVPAHSAGSDRRPSLAPELMAGISHQEAANSAAGPHSHEALQPTLSSSVRIKNWRLRITFAKPA